MATNELLQLQDTLAVDSRLLVSALKKVQIRRGATNNTLQRQTASSLGNNQIVWNVVLNNGANTIIDPYMYAEIGVSVTIGATGLAQTVESYVTDNFAPRQYPLASVTATSTVTINNQQVTVQPSQFIHPLSWNQDFVSYQASAQSITPIYPDQAPSYNELNGSMKSPLLGYASGGDHYTEPRGSFVEEFRTTVGTTGTWGFNWTIREPIMNPLLEYDASKDDREGLAYVNLLNVQLQFVANLSRMFSLDAVNCPNITGITVNVTSANLVMSWLTSPPNQALPGRTLRSFNTIVCNQTNQVAFTAGQQQVIQSQAYSFNQIPKKIWLYVADQSTDIATGYTKSDYFFSIQQVSILFNNRSGLMANMSAADLYNACQSDEGSRMTYVQAQHFVGSVIEVDPAKMLGLLETEAPGMIGTFNFQAQVQCTNIGTTTVTPNLWVTTALDTVFITDASGTSNMVQGFVTAADVIASNGLPANPSSFAERDIYGGNFLDTLKNIWDKVTGVVRPIHDFVKANKLISSGLKFIPHPAAAAAALAAEKLGYGETMGRGPIAGRRTNKKEMKRRYETLMQ